MLRAMRCTTTTQNRGLIVTPEAEWNGDPGFAFTVAGYADRALKLLT
jgi:hypothetical protein